ncbi:MAG: transcriptional repressor LexA [Leptolyngbyaceae cyanobacterium]
MEPLTEAQQELYDWLVVYIRDNQHSPSIRQMLRAMNLKSPAPIQSRLDHLRKKGYIDWEEGRARTIRILHDLQGIPIYGDIAAGYVNEAQADAETPSFNPGNFNTKPGDYALNVKGDSMIDAMICDGDVVIMRPIKDPKRVRTDTIVAAQVPDGTTLKYFRLKGDMVELVPANESFDIQTFPADQVQLQGQLIGVWRAFPGADF